MINDESDVCAQHGEEIDIADSHHQPQVAAEDDDDGGVFPHAYSPPRKRQTTHFLNIHVRAKPNVIPPPAAAMASQSSSTAGAASSSAGEPKQEGGSVFGRFLAKVRTKAAEAAESGGTGAGAAALLGSIVADKASVLYEITSLVQSVEQEEETAAGDDVGEEGDGGAGLSHHPRGFGGGSTSPRSRPVLCRVVRSLAHLEAFREDCLKRHPFSMTLTLPKASEGHRPEGVQRVVSFLVMWTASDALRNDPNFLSLMTTPDEEYALQEMTAEEEQQQQQKHHDPNSDPASADGGGATDSAAASSGPTAAAATLSKGLKQMMSKAKTLLPQKYPIKDLKPPEISDMLMETGVLDRALVSLDKMACCTRASYAFEELQTQEAARCAAWQDAAAKAQQLATAAALEAESMREVGDMLQELCYPLYWPWSRDEVIATLVGEDVPTATATTTIEASPNARTPSSTKADASGRTPNAESLPASSQSLTPYSPSSPKLASSGAAAAGSTPVVERARRPPPSQRLTHYLCRVSNIIRKLQSDAECVLSQDVLRSVQQLSLAMEGRLTAAKIAHHRVHVTHPPRTSSVAVSSAEPAIAATLSSSSPAAMVHAARKSRANLCDLQDLLLVIVRAGQGYYETDLLELLDDGTSELQDAYELAMHTFQGEWEQTRGAAVYRVLSAIVENCVAQRLASASNLMLVADVKTTLELDPFLELEELPFTNAAVVHNPSAQQKKLFEEKMKLWAELMAEQEGDEETGEAQREGGGGGGGTSVLSGGADAVRRMLLEKNNKAGGKGGKWRSALAANTYDDEEDILPCDENEGVGYGSASASAHAETTRKRRAPPPEPANPFDDATEMSAFDPSSPNTANSGSARRFTRSDEGTDTVLPDHIKEVLRRQDSRRKGDSTNLASSSSGGNPAAAATTGGGGGADLLDGVPVEELRKRDISSAEFAFDGEQNATKKGKHGNKKSGQKTSSSSSGWGAAVEDHNEDPFKW